MAYAICYCCNMMLLVMTIEANWKLKFSVIYEIWKFKKFPVIFLPKEQAFQKTERKFTVEFLLIGIKGDKYACCCRLENAKCNLLEQPNWCTITHTHTHSYAHTYTHKGWRCWCTLNETWHVASKLSASICCRLGQDNSTFNNIGEMAKMLKLHWNWHVAQRINTRTSPLKCFLCQSVVVVLRWAFVGGANTTSSGWLCWCRSELSWIEVMCHIMDSTCILSSGAIANANVHAHVNSPNDMYNNTMCTIIKKITL